MTPQERFQEFHYDNPEVYTMFKHFAFKAMDSGRRKYSARAIMERLRWELNIQTKSEDYKINDHTIPHYARMFLRDFPDHEGFFETRSLGRPDTL